MKEIKVNRAAFIAVLVVSILFLGGAIVLFALPADLFDTEDGQIMKIVCGAMCALFGLIFIFLSFNSLKKEKQRVAQINGLVAKLGDNALIFEGRIIDKESARENAKKTAASVAIATFFAAIFGFGVYRVSSNGTPKRLFIVSNEGLLVIHPQTMGHIAYDREYRSDLTVTGEKNGQITVKFDGNGIYYVISTQKTEVSQEQLLDRLNELFKTPNANADESPFDELTNGKTNLEKIQA